MKKVLKGSDKCAGCGHKRFRHRVERPDNSICLNMTCACPEWVEPKDVFEQIREAGEQGLAAGGVVYISPEEKKLMPDLSLPNCEDCGHPFAHHNYRYNDDNSIKSRPCGEENCQCENFAGPVGFSPAPPVAQGEEAWRHVPLTVDGVIVDTLEIPREWTLHETIEQMKRLTELLEATETPDHDPDDEIVEFQDIVAMVSTGQRSINWARRKLNMPNLTVTNVADIPAVDPKDEPMLTDEFTKLVEEQVARSTSLLIDKAKEYASDTDRLHNFKVAAGLQGGTPEQALGGFLAKHIVSVFDMIRSGKEYPEAVWNEKITDSINYLLILRAMQR